MNGIIKHIREQLAGIYEEPELTDVAFWIVEEATHCTKTDILLERVPDVPDLDTIIARLRQHEPIQYVFGHTQWADLDLQVTPATLIPRPETEGIIMLANLFSFKHKNIRVLDIGTGSGCIALGLKKAHPNWEIKGIDFSAEALEVAKVNAKNNNLQVEFEQVDILSSDASRLGQWDMVVSNPPYICEKERADMALNVLDYEPETALFVPDSNPLLFYRRIAELRLGAALVFEINEAYGLQTAQMLKDLNYTDINIHTDIYGKDRFVTAAIAE